MMESTYHITSTDAQAAALNAISELPDNGRYEVIIKETSKGRSGKQNKSLHLYLRMMTLKFNEAGVDQAMTFQKFRSGFSIPVTEYFLKEVFQTVSEDMTGEKHTSKLTTKQMQEVYEAFNFGMGAKFGLSATWPVKEDKK